ACGDSGPPPVARQTAWVTGPGIAAVSGAQRAALAAEVKVMVSPSALTEPFRRSAAAAPQPPAPVVARNARLLANGASWVPLTAILISAVLTTLYTPGATVGS